MAPPGETGPEPTEPEAPEPEVPEPVTGDPRCPLAPWQPSLPSTSPTRHSTPPQAGWGETDLYPGFVDKAAISAIEASDSAITLSQSQTMPRRSMSIRQLY